MSDFGKLTDYVQGAVLKRLSRVECDPSRSNQHELNGIKEMHKLFKEDMQYSATFLRLADFEEDILSTSGKVKWYDSRKKHPTRTEFRFYYESNPAISYADAGDTLAVILKSTNDVLFVTAPKDSQSEAELLALFKTQPTDRFQGFDFSANNQEIGFNLRVILEDLGIETKANFNKDYLNLIEHRFGELAFPKTAEFSYFARELSGAPETFASADEALISWWETEEAMFRQLEGAIIEQKLSAGFTNADDFLSFSQSIRQRRSSRAGHALEHHLAEIFCSKGLTFDREARTENKKRPDFLFPGEKEYHDSKFATSKLTMLGVKTTCKDRWRQVLSEADRIKSKHLFTLQPKISINQTTEMKSAQLKLVLPESIHKTYSTSQIGDLLTLEQFIEEVCQKEHRPN